MLRVLATWEPAGLPPVHAVEDPAIELSLGMLPGVDAVDWFAWACDPREDYAPGADDEPSSYLKESADGVHCRRHPEAMLRDASHLWDVVSKWRSGVRRELSREEYEALSNFEIECWLVLLAAHNREEKRRLERREEGNADDS